MTKSNALAVRINPNAGIGEPVPWSVVDVIRGRGQEIARVLSRPKSEALKPR